MSKDSTIKSALARLFNYELDQSSPVQDDVARIVNYDEDGNEFITYEKVDYPKLQRSLGSVLDWSLSALLKAGVNPNFPIHTGNSTRLDGLDALTAFENMADEVLSQMDIPANEE